MGKVATKIHLEALSNLGSGVISVVTSGTAVPLSTSTKCSSVTIKANPENTGDIHVGNSLSQNFRLAASEFVSLDVSNLSDVYLDSDIDGEGVSFIYLV